MSTAATPKAPLSADCYRAIPRQSSLELDRGNWIKGMVDTVENDYQHRLVEKRHFTP